MDRRITGDDAGVLDAGIPTREVGDDTAGFSNEQAARGHIPGREVLLPEAIEATGRHIGKVDSGGAGSPEHVYQALTAGCADAALAASIFHYNEYGIVATKRYLAARGVPVRLM